MFVGHRGFSGSHYRGGQVRQSGFSDRGGRVFRGNNRHHFYSGRGNYNSQIGHGGYSRQAELRNQGINDNFNNERIQCRRCKGFDTLRNIVVQY